MIGVDLTINEQASIALLGKDLCVVCTLTETLYPASETEKMADFGRIYNDDFSISIDRYIHRINYATRILKSTDYRPSIYPYSFAAILSFLYFVGEVTQSLK